MIHSLKVINEQVQRLKRAVESTAPYVYGP